MKKRNALLQSTLAIFSITLLCLLFQNCHAGYINSVSNLESNLGSAAPSSPNQNLGSCVLNGQTYNPGQKVSGYLNYSVVAPALCGTVVTRTCLNSGAFDGSVPLFANCTVLSSQSNAVDALPPGQWLEIPDSELYKVFPKPEAPGYASAVIAAWSGGAYDTKRDRMIIWGGGHSDYAGNEIYSFDLNALKWSRLTDPSLLDGSLNRFDSGYYTDGLPVARHTYNYLQYLPDPIDRFCSFGGAGLWKDGQYGTAHVDCFNFDKNMWETQKFPDTPSLSIGSNTAYDPVTKSLWQHGGYGDIGLSKLDLTTSKWTQMWGQFSGAGNTLGYKRTSDIDPDQRQMVSVGEGKVLTWDLNKTGMNYATELTTTGPQNVVNHDSPGFVYVDDIKAFVGWAGGLLYRFDLVSKTWIQMPLSPYSVVLPPTDPVGWGTFGRLRYSPKKKALVLVLAHDRKVLVYKVK
ncbi:MAG: hypothetical protein H7256_09865 [Bdellovibrio sp.]|nr:hypothetical protein [Bdellovibrio sp.]